MSEQEIIRRDKLAELTKLGIDAYPAALYPVTHHSADAKAAYEADKETKLEVCVAGRVMSINDKGKVLFLKIQDTKGIIQLYSPPYTQKFNAVVERPIRTMMEMSSTEARTSNHPPKVDKVSNHNREENASANKMP